MCSFCCVAWGAQSRSRGTSGRSSLIPEGHTAYGFVREGTLLANRVVILSLVLASRGVKFFIEQPSQSCLDDLPRFHHLCKLVKAHGSCVTVWLMCSCRWVSTLLLSCRCLGRDGGWAILERPLRNPTRAGVMIKACW